MIRLEGVRHAYGGREVLRGIDLTIREGERVLIQGPSGSGKSTLLRVLGLVEAPDAGHVRVDGQALDDLRDADVARHLRETVGQVFQSLELIPTLTVEENVALPTRLAGKRDIARARRLLDAVGLTSAAHRFPHELSAGQRARVATARALVNRPRVVIADEPTANLDDVTARQVMDLLLAETAPPRALVIATHDPRAVEATDWTQCLDLSEIEPRETAPYRVEVRAPPPRARPSVELP